MTLQPAGTELAYTVTYLEMGARPPGGYPHAPSGPPASLHKAEKPPVWYFLSMYDAVGRDYAWEDMHHRTESYLTEWLSNDKVAMYTLMSEGWPKGFFLLDATQTNVVDLSYFGLVPQAVGRGLGSYLLKTAIQTAWDTAGTRRVTVNTCTLDHPRALQTYQRHGFAPVRREDHTRVLKRPRDLSRIPD